MLFVISRRNAASNAWQTGYLHTEKVAPTNASDKTLSSLKKNQTLAQNLSREKVIF